MALARKIIRGIANEAARLPLLRGPIERDAARRFNAATGHVRLFRGVYPDFAAAVRDIPPGRLEGYDNTPMATRLADERLRICPFDYPVLFWLQKLLSDCRLLFDFGGNVGISYFGYRKYLNYSRNLSWLVYDVPAVTEQGRIVAASESAAELSFTSTLDLLDKADVLLAAGALHFVEHPFAQLRSVGRLPNHIILNKVPAYDLPDAVTLHNMGSAMCGYHLFNRRRFVEFFQAQGYQLLDEWRTPDLGCSIPLFPKHSIAAYSGFYFVKRG